MSSVHPQFVRESQRLNSFEGWPYTPDTHPHCTPSELAAAGFFFQKDNALYRDACECFFCGVNLVNWAATDIPMYDLLYFESLS
jgi:hypothetical protein